MWNQEKYKIYWCWYALALSLLCCFKKEIKSPWKSCITLHKFYMFLLFYGKHQEVVQSVNKICFGVICRCKGPPGCACIVTATVSLSHVAPTLLLCGRLSAVDTWSLRHCGTQVATQTLQGKSILIHGGLVMPVYIGEMDHPWFR